MAGERRRRKRKLNQAIVDLTKVVAYLYELSMLYGPGYPTIQEPLEIVSGIVIQCQDALQEIQNRI